MHTAPRNAARPPHVSLPEASRSVRGTTRCRASRACRRCNERRVKCDASVRGTPCTRCEERGEPNCTMIESRRGIYVRKTRRQPAEETSEATRFTSVPDVRADKDDGESIRASRPVADHSGPREPLSPMTMSRSSQQRSEASEQPADHL